jgi:hypothetical protein
VASLEHQWCRATLARGWTRTLLPDGNGAAGQGYGGSNRGGTEPCWHAHATVEVQSLGTIVQSNAFRYSPASDGQRFLVNAYATPVQPSIEVILNWGSISSGK